MAKKDTYHCIVSRKFGHLGAEISQNFRKEESCSVDDWFGQAFLSFKRLVM